MTIADESLPWVVGGLGGLFVLAVVLEALAILVGSVSLTMDWLVGVGIALPFVGGLLVGGYWLASGPLPARRYRRILGWTGGGLAAFVLLNVPVMVVDPPASLLRLVAWLRWAAALGAGGGLLIGVFEGRAIERAAEADRERIRAEQTQARERLLAYLNSVLRHEVLNTANVIEGYATQARADQVGTDDGSEALDVIQRQARELTSVIEDVRVLLEASQGESDLEPIDVTPIVQREVANLQDRFEGVAVETRLPEQAVVVADQLLRRAVANVLVNAVEHNDSDTARVEVAIEKGPDSVTIAIADNGPGIPASEQEGLFTLESREDTSHGLGLGLVATLVERYDGTVALTDTGPDGTTVTIDLPRHQSPAHGSSP